MDNLTFQEAAERVTLAFKEYTQAIKTDRPYSVVKQKHRDVERIIDGWAGKNRTRYQRITRHYDRLRADYFSA